MSIREFEALVHELQLASAAHPRVYQLRVMLFAALGYGFLVGTVVALCLLCAGVVYALIESHTGALAYKLVIPLAALIFIMLRALWVETSPPVGIPVTSDQAPNLFELLLEVREQVNGPHIHQVLLDNDFNAGIMQVPRLGVFGWQENFLVLGLPYMQALPGPEFKSVVAHEMGHLIGAHGRFGTWVYRQGKSWEQLLEQLKKETKVASAFFAGFLRWYMPQFNAYTLVMRRVHEYDADCLSATVTSPRIAADALTRVVIVSRWLGQEYWRDVWAKARSVRLPPDDVMAELGRRIRIPADPDVVATTLKAALASETGSMDTHPSFKARLEALGENAQPPAPFDTSAAEELLGPELPAFEQKLNQMWRNQVIPRWHEVNSEAVAQQKRLGELDAREADAPLSIPERWERACLLSHEDRFPEFELLVEDIVAAAPAFAPSQAEWGIILLRRGDEQGLAHVDCALELGRIDPERSCQEAHAYLMSRERIGEARSYENRVRAHWAALAAAKEERSSFTVTDAIEPHGLLESHLDAWRRLLERYLDIRSARIVRKRVEYFPEDTMLVLAIEVRTSFWKHTVWGARKAHIEAVRKTLFSDVPITGAWACVLLDLLPRKQRNDFEEAAGPPFYRAP